ncbi:globin-like protein [Lineolata rhizophorae]|uniref:nitric oxide dioxygenase n=1 Tax=Lineolata rhizophorae TaxID=578093 RepID=A0A6A6P9U5_9PEZI|nr:globin-like protein [Lineolata rhizophorae]
MALTPSQQATVKATAPAVEQHGEAITRLMYTTMLATNPSLNSIFNRTHQATGHQARALAAALHAYALHIDDLAALAPAVDLMVAKHASLGVTADMYDIVATHLLAAMKSVLGPDAMTDDVTAAWAAAYWQLAGLLVAREKEAAALAASHGWAAGAWRPFRVARKAKEARALASLYLEPADGKPLPAFLPGQFVSVRLFVPALGHEQPRQYSLSDAPRPDYFRITVKREEGLAAAAAAPPTSNGDAAPSAAAHREASALVSNLLHDELKAGDELLVSHPFGDFFLGAGAPAGAPGAEREEGPVVLLAAGVGLTCLMAMLNYETARRSPRPLAFVHVARGAAERGFAQHVRDLARARENVRHVFFATRPAEGEVKGRDYHFRGRLDLGVLGEDVLFTEDPRTLYFVCGPVGFMADLKRGLVGKGVAEDRIRMEAYSTGGV